MGSAICNGAGDNPYVEGSETSFDAAKRYSKGERDRIALYLCLSAAGPDGLTDKEMQAVSGIDGSTQRPRRNELAGNGKRGARNKYWPRLIEKNGQRRNGGAVWVCCNHVGQELK